VGVDWEVATDASFTNIIQTSRAHPTAAVKVRTVAEGMLAHSVHLEITGLEPATPYYYRFVAGNYESRGRTKTAPEPTAEVPALAFAFANCQPVASFEVYSEADPNLRKGAVLTYIESSEQEKYCVPSWARDWYIDGTPNEEMWWYFWWYKWCYTTTDGWYKEYDSWKWWGPAEQPALKHAEMGSRAVDKAGS
jgi:hypothetical protein